MQLPDSQIQPGAQEVTLATCDDEPIQFPGSIQPHGVLLVLNEPEDRTQPQTIEIASANTDLHFGKPVHEVLGQPLSVLLGDDVARPLLAQLTQTKISDYPQTLMTFVSPFQSDQTWMALVHRLADKLILEFELIEKNKQKEGVLFTQFAQALLSIKHQQNYDDFLSQAALEIKQLSHFDRVMIYQFDPEGHGEVVAEAKDDALSSFLGLRYPASDIPKQARALYLKNHLRFITDVNYQASPLFSKSSQQAFDLDLSCAVLRSVSPIHIEYLQNMGVGSTMVISLIRNDELWGLIACHHMTPNFVDFDIRSVCENLSHMLMLELIARERFIEEEYRVSLKCMQAEFAEFMYRQERLIDGLIAYHPNLGDFIDATSCVMSLNDELRSFGKIPSLKFISELSQWLEWSQSKSSLFSTNKLSWEFQPALPFANIASGLLAIPLSSSWRDFVFWFREEAIETVHWAGNPDDGVKVQKNGSRLTPRGSFELWKETVKCQSKRWSQFELDAALELKHSVQLILLQKTEILEERERQFRTLANSVPQLAWVGDVEGRIYWFNQRWYEYTGTTPETMLQEGWKHVLHPDHATRVLSHLAVCWQNGTPWEDSFPLKAQNGEYRWFLSQALPVRNRDNQIVSWFGTHTDMTTQLEIEAALRESEARFRVLTDSMPQIVWSARADGVMDYSNHQLYELTGMDFNHENPDWSTLVHPDDLPKVQAAWFESVKMAREYSIELRLKLISGQFMHVLARAIPMLDDEGRVIRWFGTSTDISKIVEARETLARSREELEQKIAERTSQLQAVNKELEAFSYSISHDLRAPLRGIDGFSMALLEEYGSQLDETGKEFLGYIRKEAGRMGMLIDGLLNLSRLSRREIVRHSVNLSDIASEVLSKLQAEDTQRNVQIHVHSGLLADADYQLMYAVLQNLLENAWKFTSNTEVAQIEFGLMTASEIISEIPVYFVKDNGAGFNMDYADKLFAPFQRLHTVREFPGTGIGLATVKRIIMRHGGHIWAESEVGKGTVFYFTLQPASSLQESDEVRPGVDMPVSSI